MNLKNYKPIFEVLLASIIALSIHKIFFYFFENQYSETQFYYAIQELYFYFFCFSAILILVLIKVKEKNIDNVGYTFLGLTTVKIGISYAIAAPILHLVNENAAIQKINFFIIFSLFLAIETIVTIRLLNKKQ